MNRFLLRALTAVLLSPIAALALSTQLDAKPVYLECKMFGESIIGGSKEIVLTLLEDQGKVGYLLKDNR